MSDMNGLNINTAAGTKTKVNGPADCTPEEVASYVCEMTRDFKKLAECADLGFLAYLIDMVHIEAFEIMCSSRADKQVSTD